MNYVQPGKLGAEGGKVALRKKSTYLALLMTLFAFVLFASPAWSQVRNDRTSQENNQSKKTSETKVQTKETTRTSTSPEAKVAAKNPSVKKKLDAAQSSKSSDLVGARVSVSANSDNEIDLITIDANKCDVNQGDTITFEVISGPDQGTFATVINGSNADISTNSNSVTVEDIDSPNNPIIFFTDSTVPVETLNGDDELEVVSSSIDCGNNNNNNHRHRHNGGNNNNNNQYNDNNENEDDNEDTDGSADINSEATTSSGNQYEDTFGNGGASASVGPGGARAQAGGANAQRSPDQYAPETGPRGDVVNEIPTEGPLPNTGGLSILSVILPIVGFLILSAALITRIRNSR